MIEWAYKRGHWTQYDFGPPSPRALRAQERLRKWGLQARWLRFPQLGSIPAKWMDVGPRPTAVAVVQETMFAFYLDPVSHMMNSPTPLLRYIKEEPGWKPNSYPLG